MQHSVDSAGAWLLGLACCTVRGIVCSNCALQSGLPLHAFLLARCAVSTMRRVLKCVPTGATAH